MNYNVMFLNIFSYTDGETDNILRSPVAFDPRKTHTRQKLIKAFEDIAKEHFQTYGNWFDADNLVFNENADQQNRWQNEDIYYFNKNNLKVIKQCYVRNENNDDSFLYRIIEITPLNIKDDGSELNVFAGLRKDNRIGDKCLGHSLNRIENTFKVKDYLWAIRYNTIPSYDTDCRDEISDTIRAVSKSLIALLFEETNNFKEEAAKFACSVYPEYNFDERHSWIREDFRLRIKNLEKIIRNKNEVSDLIRYPNFSSVEDDNGFYFASSLIKIPIISSYLEETGDEQRCGEQ